jgi:adenylate kinase family enzyme
MVGMPGSGKSTLAKQLVARGWARVNQDEMKTRKVPLPHGSLFLLGEEVMSMCVCVCV